jgi:predicted TIM-barrel fold metal-dependent hydrolase
VRIVDSQVHIWGANTPERPWPAGRHQAQRDVPLGAAELLREMDTAGVDRVVLVPPSWEGERNDLALAAAHAHPDRFAVMGRLDPDAPDARERIAHSLEPRGMLGLRFVFHRSPFREQLASGRMDWLWAEAEKHRVPIMILVSPPLVPVIDRIAERHPELKLVMDHCALVEGKDADAFRDFDQLLAIARRPNVAAKASCFPLFTADRYPYRALHPYLHKVYDAFGPQRMFWGTDLSRLPCTYREGVTLFTEELPWLSAQDLEWIMGRGICEWLGWQM